MCSPLRADEEMQFLLNVVNENGYRPNPYIEGFIASQRTLAFSRFSAYRSELGITTYNSVVNILERSGVTVARLQDLPADNPRRSSYSLYKQSILLERERRHTSRGGAFQAGVEAEVLCLILSARDGAGAETLGLAKAYFVSTSRLIDHVFGRQFGTITWFPDVLFRHLSLISPSVGDTETLIESLGTELAELGVALVDEDSYKTYFDPLISSSRLSFERQRDGFVKALEDETQASPEDLQREFEATPDMGKPLFVAQMEWRASSSATAQLRQELSKATQERLELTEKLRATEGEWERKQKDTVRHYENRIRNLSDPKKRRKTERKRKNKERRRRKGK